MVAETKWGGDSEPTVYSNEAAGPIVRNENCFKQLANYTKVPAGISWISFDFYNPPTQFVRNEYEKYVYPKMARHQKALVVPDGSSSAHIMPGSSGSRSGWAVPDMIERAREYFRWVASDTSGRVIGLMPWHWKTVNFTKGDYWDLGIESIPPLRTVWEEIEEEILAPRAPK